MCLLSLLIRRRFIFRPLESSGAGFWEVWCMSAYLIIIKFNISYFLGFEPLLFNGSNKRIPIFLVPNSTDLKNCSEFCCMHFKILCPWVGVGGMLSVRKKFQNIPYAHFWNILYDIIQASHYSRHQLQMWQSHGKVPLYHLPS